MTTNMHVQAAVLAFVINEMSADWQLYNCTTEQHTGPLVSPPNNHQHSDTTPTHQWPVCSSIEQHRIPLITTIE